MLARLQEVWIGRQIAEVKSKLQRMSPVEQSDEYHAVFGDLVAMETYRKSLLAAGQRGRPDCVVVTRNGDPAATLEPLVTNRKALLWHPCSVHGALSPSVRS